VSPAPPHSTNRQSLIAAIAGVIMTAVMAQCVKDRVQPAHELIPQTSQTTTGPSADAPAEIVTGAALSNGGVYYVTYRTMPDPIPLNQMFSIDVRVYDGASRETAAQDIALRADGRMPAHRHGMNTAPRVEALGPGHFRVRGMLLHMPGEWELDFDIEKDGVVERAQFAVTLE
jgi:hypothetical protein